jgi:hypothetical protein
MMAHGRASQTFSRRVWASYPSEYPDRPAARRATWEIIHMAKGQQAPKTNNKPKLSVKEKKAKKKEKAAAKAGRG